MHLSLKFPRVILGDLIHPVTSKIGFWPRTLRVSPALLHTVHRVAPWHVPPAPCMHSVHRWSPPLLQSPAPHTAHTASQVRNRDRPSPSTSTGSSSSAHSIPTLTGPPLGPLKSWTPSSPSIHPPPSSRVKSLKANHTTPFPCLKPSGGSHRSQDEVQAPLVAFKTHRIQHSPILLAWFPVTPRPAPQVLCAPLQPTKLVVPLIFPHLGALVPSNPLAWGLLPLLPSSLTHFIPEIVATQPAALPPGSLRCALHSFSRGL